MSVPFYLKFFSKVHKVEKFKKSQAKEDALHAKYNLSKSLLLN